MATLKIYKLHFTSPLHIGDRHEDDGASLKTIQSDTLYAALLACLAKIGHSIPEDGDLGFVVSSLFPYFQRSKESLPVYFLPMPMRARPIDLKDVSMAKKVKKVQWVDATLYEKVLAGEDISDSEFTYIQESYLTKEQLPEDANGSKEFVGSEVSQRVRLDSRTGEEDALPYYVDKVLFKYESGLYFIAEGDTSLLEDALRILSIEGVGTDRNIGFGYFEYTSDVLTLELPQQANHIVALSLLIPESKAQLQQLMKSNNVAYDFMRRGGWITTYPYNSLRKDAIYGFMPGSVFNKIEGEDIKSIGKIVDLKPEIGDMTPDHPIWRNGKAITLPINLK